MRTIELVADDYLGDAVPLRSDWSNDECPIARGIDVLGDPWVILILREAFSGATRFDDFKARLKIADNILTNRLKTMVGHQLLIRAPYEFGNRPRYEYRLGEAGVDALPLVHAYAFWAKKHATTDQQGILEIRCRSCDQASEHGDCCSHCGLELTPENTMWERPGRWKGSPFALASSSIV